MSSRRLSLLLLAAGLLTLAVELDRAPGSALIAIAAFAGVWIVRRRVIRKQHHLSGRLYRVRREVVTNAVVTGLLITLAAVVVAALDVTSDLLPALGSAAGGAANDEATPRAAGLLLDGLLSVVGVAWTTIGVLAMQRRAARRHHSAPPPAPLAG